MIPAGHGHSRSPESSLRVRPAGTRVMLPLMEYEPEWKSAPEKAIAWAVNKENRAFWFMDIPIFDGEWRTALGCEYDKDVDTEALGVDFKKTLRVRYS